MLLDPGGGVADQQMTVSVVGLPVPDLGPVVDSAVTRLFDEVESVARPVGLVEVVLGDEQAVTATTTVKATNRVNGLVTADER